MNTIADLDAITLKYLDNPRALYPDYESDSESDSDEHSDDNIDEYQTCTKCHINKPLSDFYTRKSIYNQKHYRDLRCTQCMCTSRRVGCKFTRLTDNEKQTLLNPNLSTYQKAKLLNITHQTATRYIRRLAENQFTAN